MYCSTISPIFLTELKFGRERAKNVVVMYKFCDLANVKYEDMMAEPELNFPVVSAH